MKKSTVALAIVLGTFAVLVIAAIFGAIGYFLINGISSRPATDPEKKLVVDAAALNEYGAEADPKCGKYTTTRNLDATTSISYECETGSLYVLSSAEVSPNVRDARQTFLLQLGAYKAGVAIGGENVTLDRRDTLLGTLGDDRYAAMIRSGDNDAGNIFIIRQGRVVHTVMMSGFYFDDADTVQELVTPMVEEGKKQYASRKKR